MAETPRYIDVTATVDIDLLLGALAGRLTDPDTWQAVTNAIGHHPYEYDLGDGSERLVAVQIVCEALARTIGTGVVS